ncbi:MAG TPA: glycosyltransferase, partial [Candidatus Eisenbacteria bacterium]|nr:glycosyltransferase [Candidatus Eisenbacteria bacterium]
ATRGRRQVRVLVIPSWWPHRCYPWEGVFIQEQVRAISELRPDWSIAVALWGQGEGFVSSAHFRHSPRCLFDALALRPSERATAANVTEIMTPALWWPERALGGNKRALLASCRETLRRARHVMGGVDVIHAHGSYPAGWLAMGLSHETGIPYVITEHMGPFPLPVYARLDGRLKPILAEPLARAGARIAVSPALAERIASFGLPAPEVIPNLVDERRYPLASHPARDTFEFYTLAWIDPSKGIGDLLEAIALLAARLPPAERARLKFRIAGGGPALERFRARARALAIADLAEFPGQLERDAARAGFARCDAFVLPSRHESFGIVYVEALVCGRPVVATRCGGPEWIVTPDAGVLVPVRDAPALADALDFVRGNARSYDAAAIRRHAIERFGREAVVSAIESIYRRVAARAAPAA